MVDIKTLRELVLSFPETEELPHFEKASFRVKKKIFATLDEQKKTAVVKLSPVDQSAFCSFDQTVIYPVPGGWGKQGWTIINLAKVRKTTLNDALATAYHAVASKTAVGKQRTKKR